MRRFGWCLALVAVWFVAGPVLADDADKKDEKAIRAGVDEWRSAFKAGDLGHLMTLFMPDALVALHGQPALRGKDAIRADFAPAVGKSDVDFSRIEIDSIHVNGRTADVRFEDPK